MTFKLMAYHYNEDQAREDSHRQAADPEAALETLAALLGQYPDADYIVVVDASGCSDEQLAAFSAGAKARGLMFRPG